MSAASASGAGSTLPRLPFTNRFSSELPEKTFYTRQIATPFGEYELAHFNQNATPLIHWPDIAPDDATTAAIFTGAASLEGSDAHAAVYAGHQFGQFAGQLGDGRALTLGEVQNAQGDYWEIQLKGSGKTPYSRFGDGRAVWRSSIREYLCSEAMHGLGIPTTRALCLVVSDEVVQRESFERTAMVTRLSPSFIRFGHFEQQFYGRDDDALKQLIDFTVKHYYPDFSKQEDAAEKLLYEATVRTARTIAAWQTYGFAHGVLNTDNMSILGLTIDYGPFGFLDAFNPHYIPNHSDDTGRYAFDQQPTIGLWNLKRLAVALSSLLEVPQMETILATYETTLMREYYALMQKRFGFARWEAEADMPMLTEFMQLMRQGEMDYTRSIYGLNSLSNETMDAYMATHAPEKIHAPLRAWCERYLTRRNADDGGNADSPSRAAMRASNPQFILRNHLLENAIRAAEDHHDFSEIDRLMQCCHEPFQLPEAFAHYADAAPDWSKDLCISCSS